MCWGALTCARSEISRKGLGESALHFDWFDFYFWSGICGVLARRLDVRIALSHKKEDRKRKRETNYLGKDNDASARIFECGWPFYLFFFSFCYVFFYMGLYLHMKVGSGGRRKRDLFKKKKWLSGPLKHLVYVRTLVLVGPCYKPEKIRNNMSLYLYCFRLLPVSISTWLVFHTDVAMVGEGGGDVDFVGRWKRKRKNHENRVGERCNTGRRRKVKKNINK